MESCELSNSAHHKTKGMKVMNPFSMPTVSNDQQQLTELVRFLDEELPSIRTAYDGELSTDANTLAMLDKLELLVLELATRTTSS